MTSEDQQPGVTAWRCEECGTVYFPRRLLCARCHHPTFAPHRLETAQVREVTVIRHVLGQTDWQPRRLANVVAPEGVSFTIGLLDSAGEGDTVRLYQDGTAPFGRRDEGQS